MAELDSLLQRRAVLANLARYDSEARRDLDELDREIDQRRRAEQPPTGELPCVRCGTLIPRHRHAERAFMPGRCARCVRELRLGSDAVTAAEIVHLEARGLR